MERSMSQVLAETLLTTGGWLFDEGTARITSMDEAEDDFSGFHGVEIHLSFEWQGRPAGRIEELSHGQLLTFIDQITVA